MVEFNLQQPRYFVNMNLLGRGSAKEEFIYSKLIQWLKYNFVSSETIMLRVTILRELI